MINSNLTELTSQFEAHQIKAINQTQTNVIMLAKVGSNLVGIVTVAQVNLAQGELGVAVVKKLWRLGLGTALVTEAIHWFKTYSSLKSLILTVEDRNRVAFRLYRKCGFRIYGHITLAHGLTATQMRLDR